MYLNKIIHKPILTEKNIALSKTGKYVFSVAYDASKGAISNEVKKAFGVDVLEVRTMIMPGKKRRIPQTPRFTKTDKWKKAIVKIKGGQHIDLYPKE